MAHITPAEANAWCEQSKLTISVLDEALEAQVSDSVLTRLSSQYTVGDWIDEDDTPGVVRAIIAMFYVSWLYDKTFSADADNDTEDYASRLRRWAEALLVDLVEGETEIPGEETPTGGQPAFYPTDASSALEPTREDPSLGDAKFTMGAIW